MLFSTAWILSLAHSCIISRTANKTLMGPRGSLTETQTSYIVNSPFNKRAVAVFPVVYSTVPCSIRLRIIANAAAGKRPDVINTLKVPDKCCRVLGSSCRPRPTDNEIAKLAHCTTGNLALTGPNQMVCVKVAMPERQMLIWIM